MKGLLYLIEHPNFDSSNNSFATLTDPSELPEKTYRLLAGLRVNDCQFPPNASWCEWARANNCMPTDESEKEIKNVGVDEKAQIEEESVQLIAEETTEDVSAEDDTNTAEEVNDVS